MPRTILTVSFVLLLGGCAKPVLDIAAPSKWERDQAKTILGYTHLKQPPAPSGSQVMMGRIGRIFPEVQQSAYKVCQELYLESARCNETLNASVNVYTDEDDINAYANEKDEVGVYGGLINAMTDAEIAAVLAHEYSHIMFGHVRKKTINMLLGTALGAGIITAIANKEGVQLQANQLESAMDLGKIVGSRVYSPKMEIEADRAAVYILKKAGYPPQTMRDAIVRLYRQAPRSKKLFVTSAVAYLRTHPSNNRRMAHILMSIRNVEAGIPLRASEELRIRNEIKEHQFQNLKKLGYIKEGGVWVRNGPRSGNSTTKEASR